MTDEDWVATRKLYCFMKSTIETRGFKLKLGEDINETIDNYINGPLSVYLESTSFDININRLRRLMVLFYNFMIEFINDNPVEDFCVAVQSLFDYVSDLYCTSEMINFSFDHVNTGYCYILESICLNNLDNYTIHDNLNPFTYEFREEIKEFEDSFERNGTNIYGDTIVYPMSSLYSDGSDESDEFFYGAMVKTNMTGGYFVHLSVYIFDFWKSYFLR